MSSKKGKTMKIYVKTKTPGYDKVRSVCRDLC